MIIKGLVDEDFVNYKKASMFIIFPTCSFKCDKEFGSSLCQNSKLALQRTIEIDVDKIIDRYITNPLTHSIVCGGLEPFDSWDDLLDLIKKFRLKTNDDIIIYTGYNKSEISERVDLLSTFDNIIVKFGRYIPGQEKHFDDVLGVYLASDNQYAERLER